ncbi:23S rRNA (uracil(1939)-C(5))-methyltransferase RlmD [Macrococcus hajekii]|uniref:23S rRNA (Uracil(1939)-C(5))-methyltransferase RlmD n=1 Tax=Macrococcus hajekii TaxID=198482 RepID=A0A4R6BIG8_9STAP|nr:23S rRNA (uracil(1939)-C(5))-methyltransferase RlmD [Macrococcus hajekii]TDM01281.1 23S rRNA (uracil(1939)-C(5))-methyltransferase RlmD [Macrococcus hajekii]GGB10300.1 tRNA (uracil-5-)-methyltransferase [Macrococcus hajekii]
MKDIEVKVGQKFPLTIKRLGINGEGIGYFKRKITFVPDALPGEVVLTQVTKVNQRYLEGKVLKVRERAPERTNPPCPVFFLCGGCQLQHMTYDAQLNFKQQIIIDSLEKYAGHVKPGAVKPTIGMQKPFRYRSKNQFPVEKSGRKIRAGLYKEQSNTLIDLDECIVQDKRTMETTQAVKVIMSELNIDVAKNVNKDEGVRSIMTRVAKHSDDIQVILVSTTRDLKKLDLLTERIMRIPNVVSFGLNINDDRDLLLGEETVILDGQQTIHETLGDTEHEVTADSAFPINIEQAEVLYTTIFEAADLSGSENVADLFCGAGGSSLKLAQKACQVRGADFNDQEIINATYSAAENNIDNVLFETGEPVDKLEQWIEDGFFPDVILINPNRSGLTSDEIDAIIEIKPAVFIYISRNPSTLAKDLAHLTRAFTVEYIQPVDMFPQTTQVEAVVKLTRKKRL